MRLKGIPRFKLFTTLVKRGHEKVGMPPGSLVYVGEKRVEKVAISVIDYNETQFEEKKDVSPKECFPFKEKQTVTWINVDGLHNAEIIKHIGGHFEIHPLILEDIMNTKQRPKIENLGSHIFIVVKIPHYNKDEERIYEEQIGIILGRNFIITFQESIGNILSPIVERIRAAKGRIRRRGADYLTYAILDFVLDSYFSILEETGEKIEKLEEELLTRPKANTLHAIHEFKRGIIFLRRSARPLREIVNFLEKDESELIAESTHIYLRDVFDHAIQVFDTIDAFRDILTGMLELYLSSISNKTNDVMKVLTMFAAVFIPLTFIAGLYGMNFKYMPELDKLWGYPAVLCVMLCVGIFILFYFKRKKWF